MEFAAASDWLARRASLTLIPDGPTLADRWPRLSTGGAPDWIILLSGHPGEWGSAAVLRVRARFPLARVIHLLGSWQEGERRSGRPLAGTWPVLWHRWLPFFDREWRALEAGQPGQLAAPVTVGMAELVEVEGRWQMPGRRRRVQVRAAAAVAAQGLVEACRELGHEVVEQQPEVVLGDESGWSREGLLLGNLAGEAGSERFLGRALGRRRLVISAGVRWQEVRQWLDDGVGGVIAKPFLLGDLAWWIDYLASVAGGEEQFVPLVGTDLCPV